MRPALQRLAYLLRQRTDICSLAALHANAQARQVELLYFYRIDIYRHLAQLHRLTRTGKLVCARPLHLFGGVYRRSLQPLARERRQCRLHLLARYMVYRIGLIDRVFQIVTRRGRPEHNICHILLAFRLQLIDPLRGATYADEQHARRQRIQCPRVSHFDFAITQPVQCEFDFAHHIGRCPLQRLVYDGNIAVGKIHVQQFVHLRAK